jgi:hypothetical protein
MSVEWKDLAGNRIAVTAGSAYSFSLFIRDGGAYGKSGVLKILWHDVSGTILSTTTGSTKAIPAAFAGDGSDRVTVSGTAPVNAVTVRLTWQATTNNAVSDTYFFDGVQFEKKAYPTPYVETTNATASRTVGAVSMSPANVLQTNQGWVAVRYTYGVTITGSTNASYAFVYGQDGIFGAFIGVGAVDLTTKLRVTIYLNNTAMNSVDINSVVAGTDITVVAAWEPGQVKLSVNGSAFVTAATATGPNFIPDILRIGDDIRGGGDAPLNGSMRYLAAGIGSLNNADAANINSYGNTPPTNSQLGTLNGGNAGPALLWPAVTAATTIAPRLPILSATPNLITTGSVITDTQRAAALLWGTSQQGGQTDGLALGSGAGIWSGVTNFFRRGQCDSTTDWGVTSSGGAHDPTIFTDATTPAPFSPQSIKYVCDGVATQEGGAPRTATGRAAAAGTVGVTSVYFKGTAGRSYQAISQWRNTDASDTFGSTLSFTATGAWQLLKPPTVAVAVGKTGDQLRVIVATNFTGVADTFWLAHAMLTITGATAQQSFVYTPYIATSGGSSSTSSNGRITIPATIFNAPQGWMAIRLQVNWNAADFDVSQNFPVAWEWRQDGNTRLNVLYNVFANANKWTTSSRINTSSTGPSGAVQTFVAGDYVTLIATWQSNQLQISTNGDNFTTTANTRYFAPTSNVFDIGSSAGSSHIDSNIMWVAAGTGPLVNADNATLNALGNIAPTWAQLLALNSGNAAPCFLWDATSGIVITALGRQGIYKSRTLVV